MIEVIRDNLEGGPAFARGYGLARAGLQSKPAEEER